MTESGISKAVTAAGSQANLAKALGVSPPIVCLWVHRGWVPLRRAQEIEAMYGVPRTQTMSPRVRDLVCEKDEI